MSSETIANLDYLKTLAQDGRSAPLMGGKIGLMWVILLFIALSSHGFFEWAGAPFGGIEFPIMWVAFGVIGGLFSGLLRPATQDGGGALGNRLESQLWSVSGFVIFVFVLAIAFGNVLGVLTTDAFGFIMPISFGLYAVNYAVLAKFTNTPLLKFGAGSAVLFMALTAVFAASYIAYFLSAIGVVLAVGVPSIASLRQVNA